MKNLITDILTHLKENDEARERFNIQSNYFEIEKNGEWYKTKSEQGSSCISELEVWGGAEYFEKEYFLIHALSSPQGKPICGFLEKETENWKKYNKMIFGIEQTIQHEIDVEVPPKTVAQYLRTTYLDEIDKGESHDDALGLINKMYNKIWKN